jgi:hypothetical protein
MPKKRYLEDGYYDPQLLEAALIPVAGAGLSWSTAGARGAVKGARWVGQKGYEATKEFARTEYLGLGLKLGLVGLLWVGGILAMWEWEKSSVKAFFDAWFPASSPFNLAMFIGQPLGWVGMNIIGFFTGTYPIVELVKQMKLSEAQGNELKAWYNAYKMYLVIWTVLCLLLGVYVVYSDRKNRAEKAQMARMMA